MLSKPGLEIWKENELAKAAFHEPPRDNESEADFVRRVKAARYSRTSGAADLGTSVHQEIESVLDGSKELEDVPDHLYPYVAPAIVYIRKKGFVIEHIEKVVVSMDHTFAGTCDLIGKTKGGQPFVADWKTKRANPISHSLHTTRTVGKSPTMLRPTLVRKWSSKKRSGGEFIHLIQRTR